VQPPKKLAVLKLKILAAMGVLSLSACAPGSSQNPTHPHGLAGENVMGTGFHDSETGRAYTIGGDARITKQAKEMVKDPVNPTPEEAKKMAFNQSLQNFLLLRKDDKGKIEHDGKTSFHFEVEIKNSAGTSFVVHFDGDFRVEGARLLIDKKLGDVKGYSIEGDLTDTLDRASGRIKSAIGTIKLRFEDNVAYIDYHAYKAKLKARKNVDENLDETPDVLAIYNALNDPSTFAWVTNMGVALGVSRIRNDLLIQQKPGQTNDILSLNEFTISGKALESGIGDPTLMDIPPNQSVQNVYLKGDAEKEDGREYTMTIKDKSGKTSKLYLDVDSIDETPAINEPTRKDNSKDNTPTTPLPPQKDNTTPEKAPTSPKGNSTDNAPTTHAAPSGLIGVTNRAFLSTDYDNPRLPRTHMVIDAFERNYENVDSVQTALTFWKRNRTLRTFYQNANPFRKMIQTIAETFDVPPAFAYLTGVESSYFTGGVYKNDDVPKRPEGKAPKSTAAGIFQFLWRTGRLYGLQVEENGAYQRPSDRDERLYFAPSACAAAKYFRHLADFFKKSDPTLAIMGYNMGEYAVPRVVKDLKEYNQYALDFKTIAHKHMVPPNNIKYVANTLAIYFISGDYEGNGYTSEKNKTDLPNRTVKPPFEIHDPECRAALASF
jgi:hypothetical protein